MQKTDFFNTGRIQLHKTNRNQIIVIKYNDSFENKFFPDTFFCFFNTGRIKFHKTNGNKIIMNEYNDNSENEFFPDSFFLFQYQSPIFSKF